MSKSTILASYHRIVSCVVVKNLSESFKQIRFVVNTACLRILLVVHLYLGPKKPVKILGLMGISTLNRKCSTLAIIHIEHIKDGFYSFCVIEMVNLFTPKISKIFQLLN